MQEATTAGALAGAGDDDSNNSEVSAFYGAVHRADVLSQSADTVVASVMPVHTLSPEAQRVCRGHRRLHVLCSIRRA
jgi:hypothetical protein